VARIGEAAVLREEAWAKSRDAWTGEATGAALETGWQLSTVERDSDRSSGADTASGEVSVRSFAFSDSGSPGAYSSRCSAASRQLSSSAYSERAPSLSLSGSSPAASYSSRGSSRRRGPRASPTLRKQSVRSPDAVARDARWGIGGRTAPSSSYGSGGYGSDLSEESRLLSA
jgi:hypothetical protein